jgi:hypothetical protein
MAQEPDFGGEKMKMPTERFGNVVTSSEPKTAHTFIVLLLLALLAILGGLIYWYYLGQNLAELTPTPTRAPLERNNEPETPTATAQTDSFGAMSNSDEISTIEADIEGTSLDSLESELGQIEAILEEASAE